MELEEVARIALGLQGVRETVKRGLLEWRYHGRLVARQLDDAQIVIRAEFDVRAALVEQSPATFSAPPPFGKHMMVVANLARGDSAAIEDAIEMAWQLQRSAN